MLESRSNFQPMGHHDFDSRDLPSLALDPFPPPGIVGGRRDFAAFLPSLQDEMPAPLVLRPVSPASVEKAASMMRSLAFTAASPHADANDDHQRREWAKVSRSLMRDVRGEAVARLRARQPALGARLESVLAFACGAMLGVEVPDGALAAIGEELGQLRQHLSSSVFPGDYYEEIFEADIAQLSAASATRRAAVTKKLAAERDVWAALCAPMHSTAELDGTAAQADSAGLVAPAIAARAVSALVVRAGVREASLSAAESQLAQTKAQLTTATRQLMEAEAQLTAASQTRVGLEHSVREVREAAAEDLKARQHAEAEGQRHAATSQEEAGRRWQAERELQAEQAARNELQAFQEGDLKLRAHEKIVEVEGSLASEKARLSVANDVLLKRAMEYNQADEALTVTLRARQIERARILELEQRLAVESERSKIAMLGQADAVKAADANASSARQRLYELQAQLTEAVRRREDATAAQELGGAMAGGPMSALVGQLNEQLKVETVRRAELERVALGLQADLAALTAVAVKRAGDQLLGAAARGSPTRQVYNAPADSPGGHEAAPSAYARRSPQPSIEAAAESAPRPLPALANRRAPPAATSAVAGKAGNTRPHARHYSEPEQLALTRASYSAAVPTETNDDALWSFASGAIARGGGGSTARQGGGQASSQSQLPRIGSPYHSVTRQF
ncbi:hypothetical protein T492DRAFT_983044 [Pavlovales sp. CCMP2436]|nr:hypothetical protein T492DRAFT_983044 [Pavlovales sp. CCMP2436]